MRTNRVHQQQPWSSHVWSGHPMHEQQWVCNYVINNSEKQNKCQFTISEPWFDIVAGPICKSLKVGGRTISTILRAPPHRHPDNIHLLRVVHLHRLTTYTNGDPSWLGGNGQKWGRHPATFISSCLV
jgi:hypothetical protein